MKFLTMSIVWKKWRVGGVILRLPWGMRGKSWQVLGWRWWLLVILLAVVVWEVWAGWSMGSLAWQDVGWLVLVGWLAYQQVVLGKMRDRLEQLELQVARQRGRLAQWSESSRPRNRSTVTIDSGQTKH